MKILCLTTWFPTHHHDEFSYILDSVESLIDVGHEVHVLVTTPWRPKIASWMSKEWIKKSFDNTQFTAKFVLHTCKHFSIPRHYARSFSNWLFEKNVSATLESLLQKHQIQLIHAHTELAGFAAVKIGNRLQIPTVVTLHGIDTTQKLYKGLCRKQLYEYTLSKATRVVLVGESLRPFFTKFTEKQDHFRIVHNGFRQYSQLKRRVLKDWSNRDLNFVSVSNLVEGKGIDINLYTLSKLKQSGIVRWKYKIIGDGNQRKKLENLVYELNLTKEVTFIGRCDHNQVYDYLLMSDGFILPSYREAFGIAYLEAMSCGLLTIGIHGQGPEEFIVDGKTGLLVPPNDIEALLSILKNIFHSYPRMQAIAKAGTEHVCNNFTWRHHANKMTMIYKELLEI